MVDVTVKVYILKVLFAKLGECCGLSVLPKVPGIVVTSAGSFSSDLVQSLPAIKVQSFLIK